MFKDFKFNFRYIMALLSFLGMYWVIWLLVKGEIPDKNRDVFIMIITFMLKDTLGRIFRVMWPDKDEAKNNKPVGL